MRLYSTILEIKDDMTKDQFVQSLIESNQNNQYPENKIKGLKWDGSRVFQCKDDRHSFEVMEYPSENIVAAQYEKLGTKGAVWDTEYIMNFSEMRLAIHLNRSYMEDAADIQERFSSPSFVAYLGEKGYLKDDNGLPVMSKPLFLGKDCSLNTMIGVINGEMEYGLPIVYVSKKFDTYQYAIDVGELAKKLVGVAHVIVETKTKFSGKLKKLCGGKNEYNGAVGIYYFGTSRGKKSFNLHGKYDGKEDELSNIIAQHVLQRHIGRKQDLLYTWDGVTLASATERLQSTIENLDKARKDGDRSSQELEDLINQYAEQQETLARRKERLKHEQNDLKHENESLVQQWESRTAHSVFQYGEEKEFFDGEIKEIVLDALKLSLEQGFLDAKSRVVIDAAIKCNDCPKTLADERKQIKGKFKGYRTLDAAMRKQLKDIGFEINESGKRNSHVQLIYYGDQRYITGLPSTGSDGARGGVNSEHDIMAFL